MICHATNFQPQPQNLDAYVIKNRSKFRWVADPLYALHHPGYLPQMLYNPDDHIFRVMMTRIWRSHKPEPWRSNEGDPHKKTSTIILEPLWLRIRKPLEAGILFQLKTVAFHPLILPTQLKRTTKNTSNKGSLRAYTRSRPPPAHLQHVLFPLETRSF